MKQCWDKCGPTILRGNFLPFADFQNVHGNKDSPAPKKETAMSIRIRHSPACFFRPVAFYFFSCYFFGILRNNLILHHVPGVGRAQKGWGEGCLWLHFCIEFNFSLIIRLSKPPDIFDQQETKAHWLTQGMRRSGPHCAHTAALQRLKTRAVANWITIQVPTGPLCTSSKLGADISENYLLAKLDVLRSPSRTVLPPALIYFSLSLFFF